MFYKNGKVYHIISGPLIIKDGRVESVEEITYPTFCRPNFFVHYQNKGNTIIQDFYSVRQIKITDLENVCKKCAKSAFNSNHGYEVEIEDIDNPVILKLYNNWWQNL